MGMTKNELRRGMVGDLIWTRQGIETQATVVSSGRFYTVVREDETGRIVRLRTDRLAEGTETERGHARFIVY
jgi:hypothetical protein